MQLLRTLDYWERKGQEPGDGFTRLGPGVFIQAGIMAG